MLINSIKNEIEEIWNLKDELDGEFEFNPPTNDMEIEKWEKANNISLPEQYKEWLKFSNGSKIDGEFVILHSLERLIINRSEFDEPVVIIGSMVGDGEILGFSIVSGDILTILDGEVQKFEDFQDYLRFLLDVL